MNKASKIIFKDIDFRKIVPKICPHCHSMQIKFYCHYKELKRNKCLICRRTFLPTTGTAIHYISKRTKFVDYLDIVKNEGILPVKVMCNRLNISIQTSLDWRHKIMTIFVNKLILLKDEMIFHDLGINFCIKGRKGGIHSLKQNNIRNTKNLTRICSIVNDDKLKMKISKIGKLSSEDVKRSIERYIFKDSKILSINTSYFQHFDYQTKIEVKPLKNYNNLKIFDLFKKIKDFKNFILHDLRGVATKYLQLYASYYNLKNKLSLFSNFYLISKDIFVWFTYVLKLYKEFLNKYSIFPYTVNIKRKWKTINNVSIFEIKKNEKICRKTTAYNN